MPRIRYSLRTFVAGVVCICLMFAVTRIVMQQTAAIYVRPIPSGSRVFLGNQELPGGRLSAENAFQLGLSATRGGVHWDEYRNSPLGIQLVNPKGERESGGFLHLRPAPGTTKKFKTVSISINGSPAEVVLLNHASFYEHGKVGLIPCPIFESNPSAGSVRLMGTVDRDGRRTFTLDVKVPVEIQREADALHGGIRVAVNAASLTDLVQIGRHWDLQTADAPIVFELPLRTPDEQFVLTYRFRGADGKEIEGLRPFSEEVLIVESVKLSNK